MGATASLIWFGAGIPRIALAFGQTPVLTTNSGAPVGDNHNSKTAGPDGPVLLEDIHLIEKLASFAGNGSRNGWYTRAGREHMANSWPRRISRAWGFATKFYTEQGDYDIVGNNLPVFFIRDAIQFPDVVHSLKPSPVDNKQNPNRVSDFFSHVPEATRRARSPM